MQPSGGQLSEAATAPRQSSSEIRPGRAVATDETELSRTGELRLLRFAQGGARSRCPIQLSNGGSDRGPRAIGCELVSSRRETKRKLASGTAKYAFNPVVRGLFRLGLPAPGTAILETIGRKSGRPRRNPVTNGLDDGVFWIVAEHGRRASYVRNIEANPRVRVRLGRR